jgi:hypothetical protein
MNQDTTTQAASATSGELALKHQADRLAAWLKSGCCAAIDGAKLSADILDWLASNSATASPPVAAVGDERASIRTWQERFDDFGGPDTVRAAMEAEIADLRAALQRPAPAQAAKTRDAILESAVQAVSVRAGESERIQVVSAFDAIRSLKADRHALPESVALSQQTEAAHPDDIAVDRFAAAMKAKMAASRAKGRGGWDDPAVCTVESLQSMLLGHLAKGDPVDVGNFAMMLWNRAAPVTAAAAGGELHIGVAVGQDHDGATIVIQQPLADGTVAVIYTGTHPKGESVGRAAIAASRAEPLDDDETARLRRVVRLLGMEREVPEDNATLRGCLFSVLGMISRKLEVSRAQQGEEQDGINGPLTDAQRNECRALYSTLGGAPLDSADAVIRKAAVYGYMNGRKDFGRAAGTGAGAAAEDAESLIPQGWKFCTADFSVMASGLRGHGWVTLKRDATGVAQFNALPDDAAREAFQLYISGKGKTIREAIANAASQIVAHPGDAAEGSEQ